MAFQNSNQPPHKIFKTTQEPEKHFGGTPKQTHKIEKVENKAEPTKPTATTSEFSSGYVSSHISVGETITSNPLRETHNGNGLQTHDGRQFTSSTRPSSLISPILDDSQANDSDGETPRPLSSDYDISSFAGYASAGCPGVSSSSEISGCGISLSDDTTIPNSQMQRESSSPAFSRPSPLKISSILNDPSGGGNASGPLPDNDCPGFPGPSGISGGGVSPSNAFTLISNSDGEVSSSQTLSLPPIPRDLNNLINNNPSETSDVSLPPIRYYNSTSQPILLRTLEPKPDHMEDLDSQMKSSLFFPLSFFKKN